MPDTRPSTADKRRAFRKLHESGCFVIPNPWDVGSARYLQSLGFKALATTSAGFAFSKGYPDGGLTLPMVLEHCRELVEATDLPINVDFEGGFAHDPSGVAEHVRQCLETGIAGLSIEDSTGDKAEPIYEFDQAVARIKAARAAIDRSGMDVMLVGRSENFLAGRPDLDDTIRRLKAYAGAGADCLYAPLIKTSEHIEAVVKAVAPKPFNFLNSGAFDFTVADLAGMGVRRVSVGGTMARLAFHAFMKSAQAIATEGRFDSFSGVVPNGELNAFFAADLKRRGE